MASSQKAIIKAVLGAVSFGQEGMWVVVPLLCVQGCWFCSKAWHRIAGSLVSRLGTQYWTSSRSIGKSMNAPQQHHGSFN